MSLSKELADHISACFTGIWIQSHESEDAMREIALVCSENSWQLASWDLRHGLKLGEGWGDMPETVDPSAAIDALIAARGEGTLVAVFHNLHHVIHSSDVIEALGDAIKRGKVSRTFIVVLSPVVQIPPELEKQFILLEHQLPSREQLAEIASEIATEEGEMPEGDELEKLLDASAGLTRYEAEGAFSLSLVREDRLTSQSVWQLKSGTLKKSGLLTLHRGNERFDSLGGLESLKDFCTRILTTRLEGDIRSRGVMLLSPPGCGKSQFAKTLGNETGRPTLILDVGSLLGSLVGQTEANIRRALQIADAMSPCILMIDEVEKALSGVGSGGRSDSGVGARLFGTLLTWLNDRTSDVFVICTCNDISSLPPEYARAERFDGIFFVDLPDEEQKSAIWDIYLKRFGIDSYQEMPIDTDWTGAEIRACCRLAKLLDVSLVDAAENVVPVARTSAEKVERLRRWASERCLCADNPGVYRYCSNDQHKPSRRIDRTTAGIG